MSRRLQLYVNLRGNMLVYGYTSEVGHTPLASHPHEKQVDIDEITRLANQITQSLAGCDTRGLNRLGSELYNCIIPKQIAKELSKQKEHAYLILYLDPELSWIPWELLSDGEMSLCHRFYVARSLQRNEAEQDEAVKRLSIQPWGHKALILFGEVSNLAAKEERENLAVADHNLTRECSANQALAL